MNFYPHHIRDFNNSTRHLTRVERSVYRDAIELYYDNEMALTHDIDKLFRRLLCVSDEEKSALKAVLDEFFLKKETGYTHERCDIEIEKYHSNTSAKARAGIASAAKRKQKSTGVEQVLNVCATNQEPLTNNQEPIKSKDQNPAAKSRRFDPASIDLPNCINPTDWKSWITYRRQRKLTLSETTITMQAANLAEWHHSGHDPGKIINDSIANGWQGLFEPKSGAPLRKNIHDERAEFLAGITGKGKNHESSGNIIDITPTVANGLD